jgi:4-carboxymuconolactone decarboxylase
MLNIKKSFFTVLICIISIAGDILGQNIPEVNTLNEQQASLITIAALTAKGDLATLKKELNKSLEAGMTVLKIRECLVHAYAYCGFPRSIRGLQTFMEVLEERKSKGVKDEMGVDASPIRQRGSRYERGKRILDELTKTPQGRPLAGYAVFAPVIDTFLKEHLFADIFERDVLTYTERELVTISVLSAIGGAEPMLRSHFTICLNIGLTPDQLNAFVEIIRSSLGEREAKSTKNVLNEVLGTNQSSNMPNKAEIPSFLLKGEKVVSSNFTGTVWLHMLVNNDTTFNINTGHVTFEPGARTNWHIHPGGQILLVTNGKGRYQEEGQPVREIQQGDVIKCDPNVKHWHGAAPDSEMSHMAIGTNQDKGAVKWLQPVTEQEYRQ